jgi:hypothetical protein
MCAILSEFPALSRRGSPGLATLSPRERAKNVGGKVAKKIYRNKEDPVGEPQPADV